MKCKIFVAWFNTPSSMIKSKQTMEEEINLFMTNRIVIEDITQSISETKLVTTIFYKED